MTNLINPYKFTLIVGDEVDTEYDTRDEAEDALHVQRARWPRRIYKIAAPGQIFAGSGWSWSHNIDRA